MNVIVPQHRKIIQILIILQIALYLLLLINTTLGTNKYIISNNNIFKYVPNNGLYRISINDTNYSSVKIKSLPVWMEPITADDSIIYFCYFNGIMYKGLGLYNAPNKSTRIIDLYKFGLPSNYFSDIRIYNKQLFMETISGIYYTKLPITNSNKFFKLKDFTNLKSIYIIKDNIITLTDTTLTKYSYLLNTKKLIKRITLQKQGKMAINLSNNEIYFLGVDKKIYIYNINSFRLVKIYRVPKALDLLTSNYNYTFINGVMYVAQNNNLYIFDGESFSRVRNLNILDIQVSKKVVYLIGSINNSINQIALNRKVEKVTLRIKLDNNKLKPVGFRDIKGITFVSWSLNGNYWHDFIPMKDLEIPIDSVKDGTLQFKVLDDNLVLQKQFYTMNVCLLNKVKTAVYLFMLLLIVLINCYVMLLKRYEYLYLLSLPILLIVIITWSSYFFDCFSNQKIIMLISTETVTLIICILTDIIRRTHSKEECLTKIHSFNHGNIGFNNILHLKRLCESQKEYYQADKASLNSSLNKAVRNYKNLSYPLLIEIIKEFPIRLGWIKELIYVSVYTKNLSQAVNKYPVNIERSKICIANEKLFIALKKLRQKVYSAYAITPEDAIKEVVDYYTFKHPDVELSLSIEGNATKVLFNKMELKKVASNLIDNALDSLIKKMESESDLKPKIEILIATNAFYTSIAIKDNGIKLPSINNKQLFDLAYSSKLTGGFGLFEVKKTINKYLGDIEVEQNEKQQKVFTIKLKSVYV